MDFPSLFKEKTIIFFVNIWSEDIKSLTFFSSLLWHNKRRLVRFNFKELKVHVWFCSAGQTSKCELTQKKLLEGIYFHKVTHYCLLHGSPLYSMNNALIRPVKKMPLSTLFRLDRYPESLQSEHAHQTGPRRFHESNLLWKTQMGQKSQLDLC